METRTSCLNDEATPSWLIPRRTEVVWYRCFVLRYHLLPSPAGSLCSLAVKGGGGHGAWDFHDAEIQAVTAGGDDDDCGGGDRLPTPAVT